MRSPKLQARGGISTGPSLSDKASQCLANSPFAKCTEPKPGAKSAEEQAEAALKAETKASEAAWPVEWRDVRDQARFYDI